MLVPSELKALKARDVLLKARDVLLKARDVLLQRCKNNHAVPEFRIAFRWFRGINFPVCEAA